MSKTLPAVIALALAACSSSSTVTTATSGSASGSGTGATTGSATTTGGAGGTVTLANFAARFNAAACKFELSCDQFSYAPYVISALCNGALQVVDVNDFPLGVDAGRLAFSATQAATCIDALQSSCDLRELLQICGPYLSGGGGIVGPAGACYSALDCLSEGCSGNIAASCTPGTCTGLVAVGGACGCSNCGTCDPDGGLICNTSSSVCAIPGTVGQPCDDGTHPDCGPNLVCVNNVCGAVPIAAGNPCAPDQGECAAGTYCFAQLGASNGNCANQVAVGQPCAEDQNHADSAFQYDDNECAGAHGICAGAGFLTDGGVAAGICAVLSDVGGPCTAPAASINTNRNHNTGCFTGLNCVGGACLKPPSSGTCSTLEVPCDITSSFCAGATGNCTAYIAAGGTCDKNDSQPCGLVGKCSSNGICQGSAPTCSPTL